jgi:hypothetical protein
MKRLSAISVLGVIIFLRAITAYSLLEAATSLQQPESSPLAGRGYLVLLYYDDRTTFDYYDFATDGTFAIWTLEGEGEGTYDVKNNLIFKALFTGTLADNRDFTYQIKGFIFSKRLLFGEGEEYLSGSEVKRYYFVALYINTINGEPFMYY